MPAIRRLASYNLHQGAARGAAAGLLADWQPDVFCLQETRDPAILLTAAGEAVPSVIWQPVPGHVWGSGLVVRGAATPIPLPPDLVGWVAAAAIPAGDGPGARPVHAYSIHAPPGAVRSYTRMVERILDVAVEGAGAAADLVLGGDFNVVVGRRGGDEAIHMSRAERAILDRLERDLGLGACWQAAHPGEPLGRTLRWRHRADSLPYHCDGLFVPLPWLPALQACTILTGDIWEVASDHHPVVATFRSA